MKRWLDDPEEQSAAALLAPLAGEPPAADRAQVWAGVQRRMRAPAVPLRRAAVGVVVVAAVIAGVAVGRVLLREERTVAPPPPVQEVREVKVVEPPAVEPIPEAVAAVTPVAPAPVEARPVPTRRVAAVAPPAPAPAPDAELLAYRDARAAMRADLADGLAQLTAFVAAYPASRFDAEARLSLIECKVRLGRLADAEPDVAGFLADHADNERAPEIRFIRAEISRQIHDRCDRALPDYRAAEASARVADDARFFRGFCADAVGDIAERDAALAAYLTAAPTGRHAAAARALLANPVKVGAPAAIQRSP